MAAGWLRSFSGIRLEHQLARGSGFEPRLARGGAARRAAWCLALLDGALPTPFGLNFFC